MLDRRTSALLRVINEACVSSGYKIFSVEDFLSAFPEDLGVNEEAVCHMIEYLREDGYIRVKYSGGGMYCICPLPLGRSYAEEEVRRVCGERDRLNRLTVFSFFAALLGGVLGGGLVSLLGIFLFR